VVISKDGEFDVVRAELIKDHQNSLSSFQALIDEERESTSKKHISDVEELKLQITTITTELTEKLNTAETTIKETLESHKTALETLRTEKDTAIADAEAAKAARDKEHEGELERLREAVTKAQQTMMVRSCVVC
jgi:DNA repair exonuclease SbcCD ATPase subunit